MTEKTITLTEDAYKTLKDLSELTLKIANDPKTRKKFVGIVKEIDPSRRFPDVEQDDLRAEFKASLEADKQEREAEKVKARLEGQKSALRSRYDEKAIDEIEKLMEKKGISDYEDGAILYGATLQAAKPTYEVNDHKWTMPAFDIKTIGNKADSRAKIYQAIDDINRNRAS